MPVTRQIIASRQIADRKPMLDFRGSLAINNYTYSSQNVALDNLDDWILGLAGAAWIGAWVKGNDLATIPAYIFGANAAAGGMFSFLGVNRTSGTIGKVNWQLRDVPGSNLSIQCDFKILNNRWYLVIAEKDATNTPAGMKFAVNNVQRAQTTILNQGFATPGVIGRPAMIGSSSASSAFFKGKVAQLALGLGTLTETEKREWFEIMKMPPSAMRAYEAQGTEMTNVLTEIIEGQNATLDSVNMWSEDTPKGQSRSII